MITKLTPEQEKLMSLFREKYLQIGLNTDRVDFEKAKSDICALYEWGGFSRPKQFYHFSSPMIAELFINLLCNRDQLRDQLYDQLSDQISDQLSDQLSGQLYGQLYGQLRGQLYDQLSGQLSDQLRDQLRGQLRGQLRDQLYDQLYGQLSDQLYDQLRDQLYDQLYGQKLSFMNTWFWGQQDAFWIAFYDFGREIGVEYGTKTLNGLNIWKAITNDCHWFYPFLDLCIITDKPTGLHRDDPSRLHNENGLAIGYSDGWGIYAIHGVRVPDWVVLHPDQITVEKINGESNSEIRRIMVQRYGFDRYIKDVGATPLHTDETGTLYRLGVNDENNDPITVVHVVNSTPEPDGTYKDYFLMVPPNMNRAKQAVAWTFEMNERDYAPVMQS